MKWISIFILSCFCLFSGCRSAESNKYVLNPFKMLGQDDKTDATDEEIRENTREFLAEAKRAAAGQDTAVQDRIMQGQLEIVAWYEDNDSKHIAAAKKHFTEALKLSPSQNVDAHHGLAVVADLEGNFAEAEQQYQRALAQSPSDSKILGNLGYSYLLQERLAESERYLTRATQIDPENRDAVKHLGDVFLKQGRPGEAQATYSRVMSLEEARQLVATNDQSPLVEANNSLVGKLLPQRATPESNAIRADRDELQRLRDVQVSTGMAQRSSTGQRPPQPSMNPSYSFPSRDQFASDQQQLKRELAAIDQERYQSQNGQAIRMNSTTGETYYGERQPGSISSQAHHVMPHQYHDYTSTDQQQVATLRPQYSEPHVESQQTLAHTQPVATPRDQMDPIARNVYGEMSPYQRQQFLAAQQSHHADSLGGLPRVQSQISSRQQYGSDQYNSNQVMSSPVQQASGVQTGYQGGNSDPLQTPWNGSQAQANQQGTLQVGYQQQYDGSNPQYGPQGSQYEFDRPEHWNAPQYGRRQAVAGDARSPQYGQQQFAPQTIGATPANRPTPNAPPDAFQQASLEAARMGMGLGPGTMFSTINQTAPQQHPGTNSNWNGNSYPQPQRILPTDMQPLNLQQAYGQQPVNGQEPQSQFGTASRYDAHLRHIAEQGPNQVQQVQNTQREQQYQMERQLQTQRLGTNQQLQTNMQDAWNQRPLNVHTPSPNPPVLRSPAEYQTSNPQQQYPQQRQNDLPQNQGGVTPPSYPYSQGTNQQTVASQPSGQTPNQQQHRYSQQNSYYDTAPNSNIVIPEPYQPNMQANRQLQPNGLIQQSDYSQSAPRSANSNRQTGFQMQSNSNLPLIVPGGN